MKDEKDEKYGKEFSVRTENIDLHFYLSFSKYYISFCYLCLNKVGLYILNSYLSIKKLFCDFYIILFNEPVFFHYNDIFIISFVFIAKCCGFFICVHF